MSERLNLRVSEEMTVALAILARKTGLPLASQARVLLRQALDRTMGTEECQAQVRQRRAYATNAEWKADRRVETEAEREYVQASAAAATKDNAGE